MVFGIPISTALTAAQRQNEEEKKGGDLFNSLNLRDNFANEKERVRRFKSHK